MSKIVAWMDEVEVLRTSLGGEWKSSWAHALNAIPNHELLVTVTSYQEKSFSLIHAPID